MKDVGCDGLIPDHCLSIYFVLCTFSLIDESQ